MSQNLPTVELFFPFWNKLSREHQGELTNLVVPKQFDKGTEMIPFEDECLGLMLVQEGRLRCFIVSDEGKEVTLYRLYDYDICLFSASCIMSNIQFEVHIEFETDTKVLVLPSFLYNRLQGQSLEFANYMNELISSRFSDVIWTLEQILFKNMDSRIATSLLDQYNSEQNPVLTVTHEAIAKDLGTAREVVTRILKYFKGEGLIELSRGKIEILDLFRLEALTG